MQGSDY
jgi:hypothetical protein